MKEEYDILKLLDNAILEVKDEILEKEKEVYGLYNDFYHFDDDEIVEKWL